MAPDMLSPSLSSTQPGKGLSWITLQRIARLMPAVQLRLAGISCTKLRRLHQPFVKAKHAAIVGMYQQFDDQVAENAAIVRQIGSRGSGDH